MDAADLELARATLNTLRQMAGGAMLTAHATTRQPNGLELAFTLTRMQHAHFVHWLRCEADQPALQAIEEAIVIARRQLDAGEPQLLNELRFTVPYRHHVYPRVAAAALRAADRYDIACEIRRRRDEPALTEAVT